MHMCSALSDWFLMQVPLKPVAVVLLHVASAGVQTARWHICATLHD